MISITLILAVMFKKQFAIFTYLRDKREMDAMLWNVAVFIIGVNGTLRINIKHRNREST